MSKGRQNRQNSGIIVINHIFVRCLRRRLSGNRERFERLTENGERILKHQHNRLPLDGNAAFTIYYDHQCPVCRAEIELLKRHGAEARHLDFVDISDPDFDPVKTGKDLDVLMREIHGQFEGGSWLVGVDVFREIYRRMGFVRVVRMSRWPVIRHLGDLGYRLFAYFRYRAAIRRMDRRLQQCSDACHRETVVGETR